MKDLLDYILRSIVDNPDDISIDEDQGSDGYITLTIHAHTDDIGKIIGKSGKTIHAIRDVVKILATKQNEYVDIRIAE